MANHSIERVMVLIENIVSSYDKLRGFESNGCSKDDLERELISIRDTIGEVPSLLTQIFKENPNQLQLITTYASLFQMPFVSTLAMMIPSIKMQKTTSKEGLKSQASLAIALMNQNGTIHLLKAVQTFLR